MESNQRISGPRARIALWWLALAGAGISCRGGDIAEPSATRGDGALGAAATQVLSFRQINADAGRGCGVTTQDRAYCWGSVSLGDGSGTRHLTPVAVAGGLAFRRISTGFNHSCAVTTQNQAYCWGDNQFGELGDGTNSVSSLTPVAVAGGLQFRQVSAGGLRTCGVTSSNQAYCWGNNNAGWLGTGTGADLQRTPAAVTGGLQFRQVAAGSEHSCGVTTNDRIYCWGYNSYGQLGDGTNQSRTSPVAVAGSLTFRSVSTQDNHTCGLTFTDRAYCWGDNSKGQLGDGTTTLRSTPVAVVGGGRLVQISTGRAHTCGVNPYGRAFCWGRNVEGQLGDGTTTQRLTPVRVAGLLLVRQVDAGYNHTCGVSTDNVGYCWGYNNFSGQLGDGSLKNRLRPVSVAPPT